MKGAVLKKLNRLETHDRLQHLKKGDFDIGACCQDMIDKKPFGTLPFYIFAHSRTDDKEIGVKRMIWQPRLTKPKAQENSMLFKAYPGTDTLKIIWMIPAKEIWGQFLKGQMFHSEIIVESIFDFQNNVAKLEERESDDPDDVVINSLYKDISQEGKKKEIKPDPLSH